MINLRYHIVSITAVFLALGIGITMGSTFLGKATLDRIDNNVKDARERVREVNEENSELRRQVNLSRSRSADLTEAALGRMFTDRLTDVPVVLVAAEGVDRDAHTERPQLVHGQAGPVGIGHQIGLGDLHT